MANSELRCLDEGPGVRALAAMHPNMDVTEIDDGGLHPIDHNPALRFAINGMPVLNPLNHGWLSGTIVGPSGKAIVSCWRAAGAISP